MVGGEGGSSTRVVEGKVCRRGGFIVRERVVGEEDGRLGEKTKQ